MKPILIGLAGLSGAGKSTLANHLEAQGGVKRFRFDAYYKTKDECPKLPDGSLHWDLPESLYLDEVYAALFELKKGNDIFMPIYDRRTCERSGRVMYQPAPVIFVEGLQVFSDERIRGLFDVRLWLEIDEATALQRRLQRQPDYNLHYHTFIALPAQQTCVLPLKIHAHAIIDGSQSFKEVAHHTDQILRQYLSL